MDVVNHVIRGNNEYICGNDFGWRTLEGKKNYHQGIDLCTGSRDLSIVAIDDGVVDYVLDRVSGVDKVRYTTGNYVRINHGNGIFSRYLHLALGSIPVRKGDKVSRGQVIGLMGNTGYSLGKHLHFDISEDGKYVDPKPYLDGRLNVKVGNVIKSLQKALNDSYDSKLDVDGIKGVLTDGAIRKNLLYLRSNYIYNDYVKWVQMMLKNKNYDCGKIDGYYGPITASAVYLLQKDSFIAMDKIVGIDTVNALLKK